MYVSGSLRTSKFTDKDGIERYSTEIIANDLQILPGPHDQPWLRESGALEMLLWHDRSR